MSEARYLVGDVFDRMAELPDASVDAIICSPPFLALRSYLPVDHPDKHKEIGSEATPAAFLSTLLALTREWRRILAPHGSICVELGDTYSGSTQTGGDFIDGSGEYSNPARLAKAAQANGARRLGAGWPLAKSLCLLPTLYPASLAYGRNLLNPDDTIEPWRIRNLIVWHRPNPPVGALGDKVRPSTSYITTACVSGSRWFDLDAERTAHQTDPADRRQQMPTRRTADALGGAGANKNGFGIGGATGAQGFTNEGNPAGAPPLDAWFDTTSEDVWTIPTAPYTGSHYATFPPALPRRLINLTCPRQVCTSCGEPRRRITETVNALGHAVNHKQHATWNEGRTDMLPRSAAPKASDVHTLGWTDCGHDTWRRGLVLDPFAGSGTTLMAASELGRDSIGIDLDPRNLELARQRLGMFLTEDEIVA